MTDTTTSSTLAIDDPRTHFAAAVATAGGVIAGLDRDKRSNPSPCSEWDAEAVARHLVSVLRRVAVVGRGDDWASVPELCADPDPDSLHDAWTAAAHDVMTVYRDAAILDRPLVLPFGTLPAAAALAVYTAEISIHAWDLARASGQSPTFDEAATRVGLDAVRLGVPAEGRGPEMPFDPVVDVGADAPLIDQLVAWMGRRP